MGYDTHTIKCNRCNVALEGPAEPKDQDVFSCPRCGASDTRKNVLAEIKQFAVDHVQQKLSKSMVDAARGSKFLKVTTKPVKKRSYRFKVDL